jgi:hypothetical protein
MTQLPNNSIGLLNNPLLTPVGINPNAPMLSPQPMGGFGVPQNPMMGMPQMMPQQQKPTSFADRLKSLIPALGDYYEGRSIAGRASLDPSSGDANFVNAMGLQNVQNQRRFRQDLARQLENQRINNMYKQALTQNLQPRAKFQDIAQGAFTRKVNPDGTSELVRNDEVIELLNEQARIKNQQKTGGLTVGQKKLDETFAKDLVANRDKLLNDKVNLSKIENILEEINDPDFQATGTIRQKSPILEDFLKFDSQGQKRLDLTDRVRNVVQQSLRTILGSAFTEREGNALIASYYNPALPEKFNQKRLAELQTQLKAKTDYEDARINHFIEKGSMEGFNLKPPSAEDIKKESLKLYKDSLKANEESENKLIDKYK